VNLQILSNARCLAAAVLFACAAGCQCCSTHSGSSSSSVPAPAAVATPAPESGKPANPATLPAQETFTSAEEAAAALKQAVRERDRAALLQVFGPEGEPVIFSGDKVQDDNKMAALETHMTEQLRVDHSTADKAVLYIGAQNWPFPIPVVNNGGRWSFDTIAGKDEILNRRIGRNELNTIDVCEAFVRAEKEYAMHDRTGEKITQYAQHFRSSPGKHDGLYWVPASDDISPMNDIVAEAEAEGYDMTSPKARHEPYHGYYFHILTSQGDNAPGGKMDYIVAGHDGKHMTKGFALIAWPAEWGNSGVMTFLVNQEGKVLQKDVGQKTGEEAVKITEYNPDASWQPAAP
jgi:Protein of unknown function (DUF2950)